MEVKRSKVLIVIDMQNDFVTGSLGTEEAKSIVPKVCEKIKSYEDNNNLVIFTMDTHENDYLETHEGKFLPVKHCIRDTEGWQLVPEMSGHVDLDYVVHKESFGTDEWRDYYNFDYYDVEIVGLCTDICVISNALVIRSIYPESDVVVDASCCAGSTPEKHKAALEVMKSCDIKVIGEGM